MTGIPCDSAARDRRLDRRPVLGEDDQDLRALRDQLLDVGGLGLGRRLGVVRDVLGAGCVEGRLDGRLVPLGPALLLVVVPGDADRAAVALASAPALGAAPLAAALGAGLAPLLEQAAKTTAAAPRAPPPSCG